MIIAKTGSSEIKIFQCNVNIESIHFLPFNEIKASQIYTKFTSRFQILQSDLRTDAYLDCGAIIPSQTFSFLPAL